MFYFKSKLSYSFLRSFGVPENQEVYENNLKLKLKQTNLNVEFTENSKLLGQNYRIYNKRLQYETRRSYQKI